MNEKEPKQTVEQFMAAQEQSRKARIIEPSPYRNKRLRCPHCKCLFSIDGIDAHKFRSEAVEVMPVKKDEKTIAYQVSSEPKVVEGYCYTCPECFLSV